MRSVIEKHIDETKDEIGKFEKQIDDAETRLSALTEQHKPEAIRQELLVVNDIFSRAAEGLDSMQLVGAHRDRRRLLLERIHTLGADAEKLATVQVPILNLNTCYQISCGLRAGCACKESVLNHKTFLKIKQ